MAASVFSSRSQPVAVLPPLESQYITTVLEDCIDQLAVLGSIVPVTVDSNRQDRGDSGNELAQIIDSQRRLESTYQDLVLGTDHRTGSKSDINAELLELNRALNSSTKVLAKAMKQDSDMTAVENMQKMQQDRAALHDLIGDTLEEITVNRSFSSLVQAVEQEKGERKKRFEMLNRESDCRKRVKELQDKLVEVRRQKEDELQKCNEHIAHLKDQLQEMKAKTSMESKYLKKDAEVRVSCAQKKCDQDDKELEDEVQRLSREISQETNANEEVEAFLRQHQQDLTSQVEYWMAKHEKDVQLKQEALDLLKDKRDKDLARLKDMTDKYKDYESVVLDERIQKEKAKRRAEQEAFQNKAAVKVQAWWRGLLVRHQLGPYSKKKGKKSGKKSGKKGKKGGKKKKKK